MGLLSAQVLGTTLFGSGLKDEDAEDQMVDRPFEDTPIFLFARVQSEKESDSVVYSV